MSKISSLQKLYLRLDTKAVQRFSSISPSPSAAPTGGAPLFGNPATTTTATASSLQTVVIKSSAHSQTRAIKSRHFSDFTGLSQLEVLGIDDLGSNLEQIAACLTACSGTLKAVTFSLSQDLARRARRSVAKPTPQDLDLGEETPDDDDDDATVSAVAAPTATAAPANDAEARKEKAVQDTVLAILFGLEKRKKKAKKVDRALDAAALRMLSVSDTEIQFLAIISKVKQQLLEKPQDVLGAEANQGLTEILDNVSADFINNNKKALSGKLKAGKSQKPSISGNKSKKTSTTQHLALSALPPQLHNLSNDELALWAEQHAHLLGDDYLEFPTHGLPPGLPIHSSLSSFPTSSSNPLPFTTSSHPLSHPHSTSSKPTSMASSPYLYGTYSSSMAGPGGAGASPAQALTAAANYAMPGDYQQMQLLLQQHKILKKQKTLLQKHKMLEELAASEKNTPGIEDLVDTLDQNLVSTSEGSATESDTDEEVPMLEETVYFPPADSGAKDKNKDNEDELDIDMEHPDMVPSADNDSDPDQEIIEEVIDNHEYDSASDPWVEASPKGKGKGKEVVKNGSVTPKKKEKGKAPANGHLTPLIKPAKGKGKKPLKSKAEKSKLDEEDMQEYLRTTHGFHIENFSLYLIPIKASIMAKALDLAFLKRLSLLGVGPQGGFWTLMGKICAESGTIQLSSIHTDDVSIAFLHAVSAFPPLESLYLMKRSSKDNDFTPTKNPGSIDDIRVFALRRHLASLKRLVINNQDNNTWDLNDIAVRLICGSAYKLLELGISIAMNEYVSLTHSICFHRQLILFQHVLLQNIPGLSCLHALHIITLRNSEQCHMATRELRKFTLDSFGHCPSLKIKYLVLHNQVLELYRKNPRRAPGFAQWFLDADVRANGPSLANIFEGLKKVASTERSEWMVEKIAAVEATPGQWAGQPADTRRRFLDEVTRRGMEMAVAKTVRFWEVDGVEMFGKTVRLGKL